MTISTLSRGCCDASGEDVHRSCTTKYPLFWDDGNRRVVRKSKAPSAKTNSPHLL